MGELANESGYLALRMYQEDNINQELNKGISDIQLYPNPFQGQFEIILPIGYIGDFQYSIIDTKGNKLISNQQLIPNTRLISLEDIPDGIYFIQLQDEYKTIVRKIIKQ